VCLYWTGSSASVLSFRKSGAAFRCKLPLTGKWRDELAGGEVIEGAEAAAKFGVAQTPFAVQPAYKLDGGALRLQ